MLLSFLLISTIFCPLFNCSFKKISGLRTKRNRHNAALLSKQTAMPVSTG